MKWSRSFTLDSVDLPWILWIQSDDDSTPGAPGPRAGDVPQEEDSLSEPSERLSRADQARATQVQGPEVKLTAHKLSPVSAPYGGWTGHTVRLSYDKAARRGSFVYGGWLGWIGETDETFTVNPGVEPAWESGPTRITLDCTAQADKVDFPTNVQLTLSLPEGSELDDGLGLIWEMLTDTEFPGPGEG